MGIREWAATWLVGRRAAERHREAHKRLEAGEARTKAAIEKAERASETTLAVREDLAATRGRVENMRRSFARADRRLGGVR